MDFEYCTQKYRGNSWTPFVTLYQGVCGSFVGSLAVVSSHIFRFSVLQIPILEVRGVQCENVAGCLILQQHLSGFLLVTSLAPWPKVAQAGPVCRDRARSEQISCLGHWGYYWFRAARGTHLHLCQTMPVQRTYSLPNPGLAIQLIWQVGGAQLQFAVCRSVWTPKLSSTIQDGVLGTRGCQVCQVLFHTIYLRLGGIRHWSDLGTC